MIQVFISEIDAFAGLRFYIVEQNEFDHKRYILHFGKHNITREEVPDGNEVEPTFILSQDAGHQFLKGMAEKAAERNKTRIRFKKRRST